MDGSSVVVVRTTPNEWLDLLAQALADAGYPKSRRAPISASLYLDCGAFSVEVEARRVALISVDAAWDCDGRVGFADAQQLAEVVPIISAWAERYEAAVHAGLVVR